MKNKERSIRLYRKVYENEPMEERHEKIMKGLKEIEGRYEWRGLSYTAWDTLK